MVLILSKKTLLALVPYFIQAGATVSGSASGSGTTTRYWDCCKPSCAWPGKTILADGATPVKMCNISDSPITDSNAVSGCNGGDAYMCSDNSPQVISDDLAYGYAAVSIAGGSESSWCCACYELTFTSTAIKGKKMIVQATNTGSDLGSNQFDLAIPGGGVGIYNGCTAEWGAPSSGWGQQYGGISSASACATFPTALQTGCSWRFDWFQGADNPTVDFVQVECPAALTSITGCVRQGEDPTGSSSVSSVSSAASTASASTPATSSTAPVVVATTSSSSSSSPETSSSAPVVVATTSSTAASSSTESLVLQSQAISTSASSSPVVVVASSSPSLVKASSSVAAVATSTSTPSIASPPVRIPQSSSASSSTQIQSPTTTAAPSSTQTTSMIMVTVTAKPGAVIPEPDYCEL